MADQKSGFSPVDPAQLTGPFSGFLRPPEPTRAEQTVFQVPAPLGKLGGIASVASAFLEGATKGRIKKYEMEENAKLKKIQILNGYMHSIMNDPNITDEAKSLATQQYYQALGGEIQGVSGKGNKKGQEGGTAAHHFANIMKDLATGMVGGKQPKDTPDPGSAVMQIQGMLYGPDGKVLPQFNRQDQISGVSKQIQERLKSLPPESTQEEANRAVADLYPALQKVAGPQADSIYGSYLGSYRRAPAIGSQAELFNELRKTSAQQQPQANPPGVSSSSGIPMQETGGMAVQGLQAEPQKPGPPETPTRGYNPVRAFLWDMVTPGSTGKPQDVEYVDSSGKPRRSTAVYVNNMEFQGWVDPQTHQPIQTKGDIRIASTAEPRQERFTPPKVVKGDPARYPGTDPKKWYEVSQSLDTQNKSIVIGEAAIPSSERPRAARGAAVSAATLKFERQEKVYEAINKVYSQALEGGMPADLSPADSAKWLRRNLQYYGKDKSVSPYTSEVIDWIEKQARTGTFKTPSDIRAILDQENTRNQQNLDNSKRSDQSEELNRSIKEWMDTMLDVQDSQKSGAQKYEEFEK